MNTTLLGLADRIRGELPELDLVVQRGVRAWAQAGAAADDQDLYLDSVALNLHSFYSGAERLFELIAKHVDRALPDGQTWHRTLLQQMSRELANVRPAVISENSTQGLDDLRRFRHLVRNVYTVNLVPEKIAPLLSELPELWAELRAEFLAFADFVEELARADSNGEP